MEEISAAYFLIETALYADWVFMVLRLLVISDWPTYKKFIDSLLAWIDLELAAALVAS